MRLAGAAFEFGLALAMRAIRRDKPQPKAEATPTDLGWQPEPEWEKLEPKAEPKPPSSK